MMEGTMDEDELKNLKVDKVIDVRGITYPVTLLATRRSMAEAPKGAVMEVISYDPNTNDDIPIWANKAGHEYLGTIDYLGYCGIFVRNGG